MTNSTATERPLAPGWVKLEKPGNAPEWASAFHTPVVCLEGHDCYERAAEIADAADLLAVAGAVR
jgi:hypothetical protein